jgi:hypothetical protein
VANREVKYKQFEAALSEIVEVNEAICEARPIAPSATPAQRERQNGWNATPNLTANPRPGHRRRGSRQRRS